jgi:hypothetical protein
LLLYVSLHTRAGVTGSIDFSISILEPPTAQLSVGFVFSARRILHRNKNIEVEGKKEQA